MAYLTLLSIATDKSSFTLKDSGSLVTTTYNFGIIRHKMYGDTEATILEGMIKNDAEWNLLFSSTGIELIEEAVDGVHVMEAMYGTTHAGANVSSAGVVSWAGSVPADNSAIQYVSLESDPYTLYAYDPDTNTATGLDTQTGVGLVAWTIVDENYFLVVMAAEEELAADIRAKASKGCNAVKQLMDRYMDIMSAMQKFNCGDYQGAIWLLNPDSELENCGC